MKHGCARLASNLIALQQKRTYNFIGEEKRGEKKRQNNGYFNTNSLSIRFYYSSD